MTIVIYPSSLLPRAWSRDPNLDYVYGKRTQDKSVRSLSLCLLIASWVNQCSCRDEGSAASTAGSGLWMMIQHICRVVLFADITVHHLVPEALCFPASALIKCSLNLDYWCLESPQKWEDWTHCLIVESVEHFIVSIFGNRVLERLFVYQRHQIYSIIEVQNFLNTYYKVYFI